MSKPSTVPAQRQDRQPGIESEMRPKPECMPRFPGSGRLKDKIALITGGDSGIGRAVAISFAREGASVAIVYLDEEQDAHRTRQLVEKEGANCLLISGDIGDETFCQDAVHITVEEFGGLDILVNNAAEQHPRGGIEEISAEQLERTYRTNIFSIFHLTKAALAHLGEGSAIINTTSVTAYQGHEALIDYSSTKGAIVAFTRSLSEELAPKGIRVNAVAPGPIWTPLIPSTFSPEKVDRFGTNTPLGRPGQPNEVAPCFLFLACADSSYMTGQVLHPNGGRIIAG